MAELGVLVCNRQLPGGKGSGCSQNGVRMCAHVCACLRTRVHMCMPIFLLLSSMGTESRAF